MNRTVVWVGKNSALRRRAFPTFDRRVRSLTLVPQLNSRGDSPQYAADSAEGSAGLFYFAVDVGSGDD